MSHSLATVTKVIFTDGFDKIAREARTDELLWACRPAQLWIMFPGSLLEQPW